jgi:hypothetical protein
MNGMLTPVPETKIADEPPTNAEVALNPAMLLDERATKLTVTPAISSGTKSLVFWHNSVKVSWLPEFPGVKALVLNVVNEVVKLATLVLKTS